MCGGSLDVFQFLRLTCEIWSNSRSPMTMPTIKERQEHTSSQTKLSFLLTAAKEAKHHEKVWDVPGRCSQRRIIGHGPALGGFGGV